MAGGSWGQTGLHSIPTADVLGSREIYVDFGAYGTERRISSETIYWSSLTVGALEVLEFGVDTDWEGWTSGHIKLLLLDGDAWGMAAGIKNIADGARTPYFALRWNSSDRSRVHGGVLHDGQFRLMLGVEWDLGDDWLFLADAVCGRAQSTWLGFYKPIGESGLDFTVAAGVPHRRSNGYQYSFTLGYGTRF